MLVRESTLLLIKMDLFEKHGMSHLSFSFTPTYSTEYDIHDTCDQKTIVRVCAFMNMSTIAQFLFICMIYLFFNLVSLSLFLTIRCPRAPLCRFWCRFGRKPGVTVGFRFFCSDLLSGVGLPPKKTGSQP